ncbi:hypothetical protein NUACC21_21190 [Scytonema sp. NUACC21]
MAQFLLETVWLVPCYALIGGLLALPWSPGIVRKTGPRPAGYVNLIMTFLAFVHSALALTATWNQLPQGMSIPWLNTAGLTLSIDIEISSISVGAMAVVAGLNLLAQIYAIGYMEMDWGWARFYSLLGLFEAGLCALALCNSLFFSYVILEILTLGTYLLVGLWFSQPLVVTGARDAFLTKRVGDLFLLAWWHMEAGKDANRFADMLVETARTINPDLTIIDGIIGHEGNGPSGGEPRPLGVLGASSDIFALDRAMVEILNVQPEQVPTIAASMRLGLVGELDAIYFPNLHPNLLKIDDWRLPDKFLPIDFGMPRVIKSTFKHLYIRFIKEPINAYAKR